MNNCTPLAIGCYTYCEDIVLPLVANYTGVHTLEYHFKGAIHTSVFEAVEGQNFVLPNVFNESSKAIIRIYDNEGNYYQIVSENGETYTYFSFNVRYQKNLELIKKETEKLCGKCAVNNIVKFN